MKHSLAATAAAEPPDDPPGTFSKSHGFFVTPYAEVSVVLPMANSSMFVFPKNTTPSLIRFSTACAEYVGTKFSKILELHVVVYPFVQILSLIAIGTPANGPV